MLLRPAKLLSCLIITFPRPTYKMKTLLNLLLVFMVCTAPSVVRAIDPNPTGSVSPSTVTDDRTTVTFTRDGTCNDGFAWTEATLWRLTDYVVLGNVYSSLYYQQTLNSTGSPGAPYMSQGPGTYWIQYRLVDIYYNYNDQWLTIGVDKYSVPAFTDSTNTPASAYDAPTYWNSSGVQYYNNCYNYATNVANFTFAKPGYAHGYDFYNWEITDSVVDTGVTDDGLPSSDPGDGSTPIAMMIWVTHDFHFARLDNNSGTHWSHKMAHGPAKDTDNSNQSITDPSSADWGSYSYSGLYYAPSEVIQGYGHADISGPN
jgi:hypothetical protein